jgi:hypothetical protein
VRNHAVRLGASALALTAVFAVSACAGNAKTDDAKSDPKTSPSTASPVPSSPGASSPSSSTPSSTAVPRTTEAAIARYLTFLRAVSRRDLKTMCVIAGPAAKKAEDEGFGKCRTTFTITLSMFSPAQLKALRTATVDKSKVTRRANGNVDIPARAVVADVRFTEHDLSDMTLSYRHGDWFIID